MFQNVDSGLTGMVLDGVGLGPQTQEALMGRGRESPVRGPFVSHQWERLFPAPWAQGLPHAVKMDRHQQSASLEIRCVRLQPQAL